MSAPAPDGPVWFKSSYSGGEQDCVEVAKTPGAVHVRDSKDKAGATLAFTAHEFAAFTRFAATREA